MAARNANNIVFESPLRVSGIASSATGNVADVQAATATVLETGDFLNVIAGLYAMGAADLDRLLAQGSDADNVATVATGLLRAASYLYGYDGAAWDRILAVAGAMVVTGPYEDEDTWVFGTSRVFPMGAVADDAAVDSLGEDQVGIPRMTLTRVLNAVLTDPTTITQRQAVMAPAVTLDETLARHALTAAALYGMGTADLERLLTGSVGLATLQDTVGTGILPQIMLGVFDDTAVSATENQFGAVRMTATRILNSVASDPTTPTQRQRVLAANVALSETATQYATMAAVLFGRDTAAVAGSQLVGLEVQSTASPNLRSALYDGDTGPANLNAALGDGAGAGQTKLSVDNNNRLFNGGDWDRQRGANIATATISDTTGIGIAPAVLMAMFDDTGPASITENQFGALRSTATRVLLTASADPTTPTQRQDVDADGAAEVATRGKQVTLTITTPTIVVDGTVNNPAVTGLDKYVLATIQLVISAKTMDAATTLNIYVQYSPDGGTTWDDLVSFAQVTNAAIGNGTYVVFLNATSGSGAVDRLVTDGTLAVNTLRNIDWADRLRVKTVALNFAGADTITLAMTAYLK